MDQPELFIGIDVVKPSLKVAFGHAEQSPVERICPSAEAAPTP